MKEFFIYSLIGSIVLTVLINLLALLFPKTTQKTGRALHKKMGDAIEQNDKAPAPRVKVFLPWKAMLIASLILTVLVNCVAYFAGR